jgi:hypothetical protein
MRVRVGGRAGRLICRGGLHFFVVGIQDLDLYSGLFLGLDQFIFQDVYFLLYLGILCGFVMYYLKVNEISG